MVATLRFCHFVFFFHLIIMFYQIETSSAVMTTVKHKIQRLVFVDFLFFFFCVCSIFNVFTGRLSFNWRFSVSTWPTGWMSSLFTYTTRRLFSTDLNLTAPEQVSCFSGQISGIIPLISLPAAHFLSIMSAGIRCLSPQLLIGHQIHRRAQCLSV